MSNRGMLRFALRARWCRALAVAGACVLAAQSMQLPLLTAEPGAACCCSHKTADASCKCPVCAHDRDVQSGKPFFKTCGSGAGMAALTARETAVPAAVRALPLRSPHAPVQLRVASPPPDPALDVPTPPPLARA